MELRSLRYFIAVLEAGSLSRAAGALYVAQPALTAQIKKLETELGTQLFERSHVGVTPTAAGLQLYQDARKLLSDAAAMRERLQRAPDGLEGSVTVAVPFLLASLLLGPVLARLKKAHPRIRVFVIDDLSLMVRKAMVERRADIGILVDTEYVSGLDVKPFVREAMFVCGFDANGDVAALAQPPAGKKAARGKTRTAPAQRPELAFAHAASLPLVLQSRRFSIRAQVEETAADLGLELNIAHEHDSARVIRSLYLAGAGFTFSPACAMGEAPPAGSQWLVARVVQPDLARTYFLATPSAREPEPDPVVQAVRDALVDEARDMIASGRWEAEFLLGQRRAPAKP
ncbi:LysR family transcriptional regulator [Variovorax sp. H27-G14]|uniref:LysR family transcriptional regulator n=1 Tax=Variovorax sp. H27-G14 TaxID=3111914 RepID=UPI0038FC5E3E